MRTQGHLLGDLSIRQSTPLSVLSRRTKSYNIRADQSSGFQSASPVSHWLGVQSSHPIVSRELCAVLRRSPELHRLSGKIYALDFDDGVPKGPAIIILDVVSANLEAVRADIRKVRGNIPESKLVGLAGPRVENVVQLLQLGFSAVVQVGETFEDDLVSAVTSVMSGSIWASQSAILELIGRVQALLERSFAKGSLLTAREGQVLELALWGLSNKEMADNLRISERTIKFHISNILSKVGVRNRHELTRMFRRSNVCG